MTVAHEAIPTAVPPAAIPESVRSRLDARFSHTRDGRVRADVTATSGLELRGPFASADTHADAPLPRYVLRNVTAGLFDGDEYTVNLHVEDGTAVAVSPTSAGRVFVARNLHGESLHDLNGHGARVRTRIEVAADGVLDFDAGLTIPHAGSIGEQHIEIILHAGAVVAISEALAFGRLARGERFAFVSLTSSLSVRTDDGRQMFHRRSVIEPARQREALEAVTGGAGALATLTLLGPGACPDLVDAPDAYAGISALPPHDGAPIGYSAMALSRRPQQAIGALAATRAGWVYATERGRSAALSRSESIATISGGHT